MAKIFTPLKLGSMQLNHRVVLAPLTRSRANVENFVPHVDVVSDYYSQRATDGGLLISEAVNIAPEAVGQLGTPGIWNDEQTDAWKQVVESVHAKNGLFCMQLWHTGRLGTKTLSKLMKHPILANAPNPPSVSSSAVAFKSKRDIPPPRALREDELPRVVSDYVNAAKNAIRAGCDAVEIHGAHGYLLDQFLLNGTNQRTDKYGGSIENRSRLLLEVVDAVTKAIGSHRVAVRLSPVTKDSMKYFQNTDSDPDAVYTYVIKQLAQYNLCYLLLTEPRWFQELENYEDDPMLKNPLIHPTKFRQHYPGPILGAGGFTPSAAIDAVDNNEYDAVAFGRWFISNPDLMERLKTGSQLNRYNRATFYGPMKDNRVGYTDYPDMAGTIGEKGKYPLVDQNKISKTLKQSKL